ncbi:hypothetical protein PG985_014659 [Apiospora marii]|uniref:MARVEL domain-containing protein n=1 Tax=Apiospora marii TaxID=335849 RepID=A0ABR1R4C3_9PEZI
MSAGRANRLEPPPPPPPMSLSTSTTNTAPKPAPAPAPSSQTGTHQQPPPAASTPYVVANLPPRNTLPELPQIGSDAAWVTIKILLRALCLTLGLLLAGFGLAAQAAYRRQHQYTDRSALLVMPYVSLPVGLAALVWNGADFAVMGARRSRRRGISAKAHVGMDLLLWLLGVAGSVVQAIVSPTVYGRSGDATVAFLAILGVLEFALFVRSCLEVDRRKKDQRIQQLVIALQMQQQQQQQQQQMGQIPQQPQQQQQHNGNTSSPTADSATWASSDYDRELNTKYQGPMPEPLYDPRDLQKVLIVDPRLRGIVN